MFHLRIYIWPWNPKPSQDFQIRHRHCNLDKLILTPIQGALLYAFAQMNGWAYWGERRQRGSKRLWGEETSLGASVTSQSVSLSQRRPAHAPLTYHRLSPQRVGLLQFSTKPLYCMHACRLGSYMQFMIQYSNYYLMILKNLPILKEVVSWLKCGGLLLSPVT